MKTVLISSFHPLISRNILATPLLSLLTAAGIRIVLAVPEKKSAFFNTEFAKPDVIIAGVPRDLSWRDRLLRYLALAAVGTRSLAIKRRSDMGGSGAWLAALIANKPFVRRIIRALDSVLTPRGRFTALLECERLDLVFSTDVQNENDVRLIHEAKRRGVPVVGMVRSWDNLTSKGLSRALPDRLVVQNEIIRAEAISLHGVPADEIEVVGIPHYDRYIARAALPADRQDTGREGFFQTLGLNPAKRLVVYAPVGDRYVGGKPVDRDIIAYLASLLPATHQLLVRLPPMDSVNLEGLGALANVTIMRPGRQLARDPAMFRSNELSLADDDVLRDTLAHCDVAVSGPSTFAVDAAVFDKPVILIAFDGRQANPYDASIARYYEYEHFKPLLAAGGARLVRGEAALREELSLYLADAARDAAGRRRIAEEQCGRLDGKSTERLASVLVRSLSRA
ncbi:MAG: CDP-glycerol glycerophosphotransferase family protein [bacterium]|nr:CDP-glycerol glycerophosphotransferase family protein [bacterium]